MTPMQYELNEARKERLQRMKAWPCGNVVQIHRVRPKNSPKSQPHQHEPEPPKKPAEEVGGREVTPLKEIPIPTIFEGCEIDIRQIQEVVAKRYKVEVAEIKSNSHKAFVVLPRQIAYTLARRLTGKYLPTIARSFGGRDHTTILQGIRKIEKRASEDPEFAAELAQLERIINGSDAIALPAPLVSIE